MFIRPVDGLKLKDMKMNKSSIVFHLKEALEELEETIGSFEKEADYSEADLEVGMGHLYHHLNTAWNGRSQSPEQFTECSGEDFERFRKFPKESEFIYLAGISK
ncbi:MAG: hypothetical protein GXP30_07125 [Verrucomicrobia bacterium]|nr:hypothetical protein [Verrucomicrobiota bacterium]